MKNNILSKTVLGIFTLVVATFTSQAFAQSNNMIEEVKIVHSDNFSELKSLLNDNFDYQDVDTDSGVYNSEIKFDISKEGKVQHIIANGTNEEVNAEIKETLAELTFTFDKEKLNKNMTANTYVIPVQLVLED